MKKQSTTYIYDVAQADGSSVGIELTQLQAQALLTKIKDDFDEDDEEIIKEWDDIKIRSFKTFPEYKSVEIDGKFYEFKVEDNDLFFTGYPNEEWVLKNFE